MINKKLVLEVAKKHDSFYLYDEKVIVENAERLNFHWTGRKANNFKVKQVY